MPTLSKTKLNKYKNERGLSNSKISELTGLQIATVDKIFCGANKNPTLETLKKLTKLFNCTIDDFLDYEDSNIANTTPTVKIDIENPNLKVLYDNSKNLNESDLNAIIYLIKRIQN